MEENVVRNDSGANQRDGSQGGPSGHLGNEDAVEKRANIGLHGHSGDEEDADKNDHQRSHEALEEFITSSEQQKDEHSGDDAREDGDWKVGHVAKRECRTRRVATRIRRAADADGRDNEHDHEKLGHGRFEGRAHRFARAYFAHQS